MWPWIYTYKPLNIWKAKTNFRSQGTAELFKVRLKDMTKNILEVLERGFVNAFIKR